MILEHWSCLLGFHHVLRLSLPLSGAVIIHLKAKEMRNWKFMLWFSISINLFCIGQLYALALDCFRWFSLRISFWLFFGGKTSGHHAIFLILIIRSIKCLVKKEWTKKKNIHWNRAVERLLNLLPQRTSKCITEQNRKKNQQHRATDLHSDENLFLTVMQTNARNGQGATRESAQTHSFQFQQTIWFTYDSIDMLFVLRVCVSCALYTLHCALCWMLCERTSVIQWSCMWPISISLNGARHNQFTSIEFQCKWFLACVWLGIARATLHEHIAQQSSTIKYEFKVDAEQLKAYSLSFSRHSFSLLFALSSISLCHCSPQTRIWTTKFNEKNRTHKKSELAK